MANEDPIVAEVRAFRERHAARFDYDIGRICRDIRERQEEQKRLVAGVRAVSAASDRAADDAEEMKGGCERG